MLGNEKQRAPHFHQIEADVDFSLRLSHLLQKLCVVTQPTSGVQPLDHVLRYRFSMDILTKA